MIKTILLVALAAVTIWVILRSRSALDFRETYLESPAASQIVEYQGVRMTQGDFVLHYAVKDRVNPFAAALVRQDSSTLWGLLYLLHGLLGCYLYYLMSLIQQDRSEPGMKFATRLLARLGLAALSGILCYLLVKPIASPVGNLLGNWVPKITPESKSWTVHSVSDAGLFFPVLAGASLGAFYKSLEGLLRAFIGRLETWFGGKK